MSAISQHRGAASAYAHYFAAMDAAMQQKVALTTAHLPTRGRIADMGSGSGKGTFDLGCLYPELEVIGVDLNPISVAAARDAHRRGNVSFIEGDIATAIFPSASLDGILNSSVLHHVTSYNGFSRQHLERCLDHQVESLKPDGVMIIRDFIIPEGPDEVLLDLRHDDGAATGTVAELSTAALFGLFARDFRSSQNRTSAVPCCDLGSSGPWQRFQLPLRAAQEFILRKDYRADWSIELQEEYTYWTRQQGIAELERRGLRVVVAADIRNPWIIANRYRGRLRLISLGGEPLPFPPTNALLVGERIAGGGSLRIREVRSTAQSRPGFLAMTSYAHAGTGKAYDLVSRPGRTLDLLPWFRQDERIWVLAKKGFPRPVITAASEHPDLMGSQWSGHITEPISAIIGEAEDDLLAIPRLLHERAALPESALTAIGAPWRYLPSPGGIDERVIAYPIEVAVSATHALVGASQLHPQDMLIRALDARQVLRCAHVGGLFDARLELGCYRLLKRLGLDWGPWIGACISGRPGAEPALEQQGLSLLSQAPFLPIPAAMGFLECRLGSFVDQPTGPWFEREYVLPKHFSRNTLLCLPYRRSISGWWIAVEERCLPALQLATGNAVAPCAPAWRLPMAIRQLDQAEGYVRQRLSQVHGLEVDIPCALGGAYLPTSGATPELIIPYVAEVLHEREADCKTPCRWLRLEQALVAADTFRDAHLAIAVHRFAHAVQVTLDPVGA